MKIKAILESKSQWRPGWLYRRFGEHYARISTSTTRKLRSAIRDVARFTFGKGKIPYDIEALCKRIAVAPQGVDDYDFIFGYESEGKHEKGSIETDPALMEYVKKYPKQWSIVVKTLSLQRSLGQHACLPAGELILVKDSNETSFKEIGKCHEVTVPTGQGNLAAAKLVSQGTKRVREYTLSNQKKVICTPDHLVLTIQHGWIPIEEAFRMGADLQEPDIRQKTSDESPSKTDSSA